MKKKVVWLVVTGGMVAALLLASCAPAAVKEEAEKVAPPKEKEEVVVPREVVVPERKGEWVKWTGKKLDGTVVEKMMEKPRYGGVHITTGPVQPAVFDDVSKHGGDNWAAGPIYEGLLIHDWTRGPAGTGEWDASAKSIVPDPYSVETGLVAERWELADATTLVYHIRRGIRFALDPTNEASRLVGGRELTAADVVWNLRRYWATGYASKQFPYLTDMKNVANSIYVSPTDKWAVVMKVQPGWTGRIFRSSQTARVRTHAPEVRAKYNENDWRLLVGTGPFMLREYVGASSLAYVRNPNYWGKDPFFPENQLPYLDGFKLLIIPDLSTQVAALRTGKIDSLPTGGVGRASELSAEDARAILKTNPELQSWKYLSSGGGEINMRNDTKPFNDIRVRRALHMAINFQELKDLYHGGEAEMFTFPVAPVPEYKDFYIPLEKLPESVRELFGYKTEKARQLLAEAGYPQGFKTEIITTKPYVDILSIIKEYWAKIGVDLKIEVRDDAVHTAIGRRKTHTQMYMTDGSVTSNIGTSSSLRTGGGTNYSIVDNPWDDVIEGKVMANYFDEPKRTAVKLEPLAEGLPNYTVYLLEQAWLINLPQPYKFVLWQPWLKGYYGANWAGYGIGVGWPKYAWLDLKLKKAMGR